MSDQEDAPALVQMGAGSDKEKRDVNLDVSGTVGPDYLGQETTTVPGHSRDRPGVRSRVPEQTGGDHPLIRRMDTGEELPVLLSSSMSADPVEGVNGSYTEIVEGECARCGYDRLRVSKHTMAGVSTATCNACGAQQDDAADAAYCMPPTDRERAVDEKTRGIEIASLKGYDAVDLEPDSGVGPYVSLVGSESFTRLRKDCVADLFFALVYNEDVDLTDEIRDRFSTGRLPLLAMKLAPDGFTVQPTADDD